MPDHFTTPDFWECFHRLPSEVRESANKCFALLKTDPRHPSLHFKKIDKVWSVRVGRSHRALAHQRPEGWVWFWIGSHKHYDKMIAHVR